MDLRLALRRQRKSPGFGITVLLTLAIGIGANTAVFTVVNSILLKLLPCPQPEQLVAVWLHAPGAAVRGEPARSRQLRRRASHPCGSRGVGKLSSGFPRRGSQSGGCAEGRVSAVNWVWICAIS
jgi:hypothetical protein